MTAKIAQKDAQRNDKETIRRTTLRIPLPLLRKVRLAAAQRDVTQQELWFEAMQRHLSTKHQLSVLDQ